MARTFNGSSEYLTLTDRGRFGDVTGFGSWVKQAPFAVSVWFYPTKSVTTRQVIVADWDGSGSTRSFAIQLGTYTGADGKIRVGLNSTPIDDSGVTAVVNTWHHVFFYWDKSNAHTCVNGVLKLSTAEASMDAGTTTAIGRAGAYPDLYFGGRIADFAVWTGGGFGPGHALALSQGVQPTRIRPERLMAYLPLQGFDREPAYGAYGNRVPLFLNYPAGGTTGSAHPVGLDGIVRRPVKKALVGV